MCGICGILSVDAPVERNLVQRMCASMIHRGPDEDGFLWRNTIAMGMRRLKIIDLSTGQQPIYNEAGDVAILYNGEVYNFQHLRRQLTAQGHIFRTQTDTEAIVHLYEQHGADCVSQLNGMFAFALWDGAQNRVLLARDRAGQKPLFYHHRSDGTLIFASELPTLLASGLVPKKINHDAIYHYLSLQYVPGPQTILQDVYQLPAGHYALWQNGHLTLSRYWQPTYTPKPTHSHAEWVAMTRQIVTEAVERHMVSDVPIGAYLSGGVDSSIVTALMARFASGRVKSFSIGFDVAEYSETDHARRIAERFNTDHHEFVVSGTDVTDALPDVVRFSGQPLADTSLMATLLLAKMTRQHVTVALTGDGGDEAFAGYTRYTLDRLLRYYRLLPAPLRLQLIPAIAARLPERTDIPTDRNIVAGVKRLAQASSTTHKASIMAWGSFFTEQQKQHLATPDWLDCITTTTTPQHLATHYDAAPATGHLDRTLYTDFVTYLQDDLLVKADRMAMAHSLETRAPFLDSDVLALGQSMPVGLRLRGKVQKVALRQAFADLLPQENVQRIKRGFGMPVASWLRGHMRTYARDVLTDPLTQQRGMFQPQAVQALLDEHDDGRFDHGQRIWALLILELWLRQLQDALV